MIEESSFYKGKSLESLLLKLKVKYIGRTSKLVQSYVVHYSNNMHHPYLFKDVIVLSFCPVHEKAHFESRKVVHKMLAKIVLLLTVLSLGHGLLLTEVHTKSLQNMNEEQGSIGESRNLDDIANFATFGRLSALVASVSNKDTLEPKNILLLLMQRR